MLKLTTASLFLAALTSQQQSLAFQSSAGGRHQTSFNSQGASILPPPFQGPRYAKTSPLLVLPSTTSSSSATGLRLSWSSFGVGGRSRVYPKDAQPTVVSSEKSTTLSKRKIFGTLVRRTAVAFAALALFNAGPALAAKKAVKDTTEHLHTGQKIANFFMSFGLPKWAVLATISAMPVVELRGAIPVGVWMGLPIWQVFLTCVFGNMIPIIPLLFLLKNETLKSLMSPILKRAEKKASGLGVGSPEKQWVSLAAFVGIPLPGTGAWTGTISNNLVAVLLCVIFVLTEYRFDI